MPISFTFMDDTVFTAFGKTFLSSGIPSIRLGSATFHLKQLVSQTTETQSWSGHTTYGNLVQSAKATSQVRFKFHSPTAFRTLTPRGQRTYNRTQVYPVRCPQSWINRWNTFVPAPLRLDRAELLVFIREYAHVSYTNTRTQVLNFERHTEIGWVGTCTFRLYADETRNEHLLRAANCLSDFALYCGK